MDYGQKIAELRKNKKLTQAELGTKLNLTAQAVSKWETGEAKPAIMQLKNLSKIFNISILFVTTVIPFLFMASTIIKKSFRAPFVSNVSIPIY